MSKQTPEQNEEKTNERGAGVRPQIWVASLSDYNAGHLHGAWIDADQEPNDIWEGINEVLRTSKETWAEEWAIFDYEGFGPLRLSEYETVERVSRLGLGIAEHGEAFAAFANYLGTSDIELLDQFEDCFLGRWESAIAYVGDFLEDTGIERMLDEAVPESLRPYIQVDAEALARDMEFNGELLAIDDSDGGDVYLFQPPT
jgi:antirestriction protein